MLWNDLGQVRCSIQSRWATLLGCLLAAGLLRSLGESVLQGQESPAEAVASAISHAADRQFFESRVRPLLIKRCGECHAASREAAEGVEDNPAGFIPAKGGLRLDSAESLRTGGDSGPAVVPGDPEASLLIEAIGYQRESLQMPPAGRLPEDEQQTLVEWVRRGAVHTGRGGPARRESGIDWERGRNWWAFRPLFRGLPEASVWSGAGWPRVRSDAWVEVARSAVGLTGNREADRRTLLRRVTYGLTGLPPKATELDEFVADQSEDAYERRVDRLLADPGYGERWGRWWLDLVRYADVLEIWAEEKSAGAWRYRDWVVGAFNADLAYAEFLERQIAADLRTDLPGTEMAALGFLGLSPSYWKELKLAPVVIEAVVADEWEERITALTGTVLGLTVACARCHDHKQDPITTEDYYAIAGMLASTRTRARPLLPEGETRLVRAVREELAAMTKERERQAEVQPPTPASLRAIDELTARIVALELATPQLAAPMVYGVEDGHIAVLPDGPDRTQVVYRDGQAIDVAVQVRGNPAQRGRVVPRGFPRVLEEAARRKGRGEPGESLEAAQRFTIGSGRLEWARRCRTTAAPLVARVFVNRVWKHHFGTGLVETPSNFGAGGEQPTHPELLDDLSQRFIASGWSMKWLQREIVLSAAYRQSSQRGEAGVGVDPGNRLLWRMPRRRLEFESWRDSILLATGRLSRDLGGPDRPLDDAAHSRRTLYGTVRRRELSAMLRLHDVPDATQHVSHREATMTPLQSLFAFNSPHMQDWAAAFASRIMVAVPEDPAAQIHWAWQVAFQRLPQAAERQQVLDWLTRPGTDGPLDRWRDLAQVLLMSNEFCFVD